MLKRVMKQDMIDLLKSDGGYQRLLHMMEQLDMRWHLMMKLIRFSCIGDWESLINIISI